MQTRLFTAMSFRPRLSFLGIVLIAWAHSAVSAASCTASGYCSAEHVSAYFGDLASSSALQTAAECRSYKQEIILMVSDLKRVDSFLQGSHSLLQLGLAHILLLSLNQPMCERISNIVPDIGCAWSSDVVPPDMWGTTYLWNMRYRTLARLIRLGYNVLLLDSDVAVMDDPYKYFKQPPFNDITVLNQMEYVITANGGILYVQNAAPDGPAAFMFAEIVARPYRWADDDWQTAANLTIHPECLYSDQDGYADVLPDMVSGYMLFPKGWWCMDEAVRAEPKWHNNMARMYAHIRWPEAFSEVEHGLPEAWHTLAGGPSTQIRSLHLRMPNCRGWPEDLGGQWYPPIRGPYSSAFLRQLQQDNPDVPLWPDPEDALKAAQADRVPTEKFAFMPFWMGIGYWRRGRHGYWDPHITGNIPQQVIAHTHFIDTYANTAMAKRVIPMSLNIYNWTLNQKAHGDNPYFACVGLTQPCPKLKTLALTPEAEGLLGLTTGWHEFALVLQGLAQLSSLLHRAVVWPSIPCDTSWIRRNSSLDKVPLELPRMWLPWSSQEGILMCTPWGYVTEECLEAGRGLLPWEWHHFQHQQPNLGSSREPVMLHAVHTESIQHSNLYDQHDEQGIVPHMIELDAESTRVHVMGLDDAPSLLVDSLVLIRFSEREGQEEERYYQMQRECLVLDLVAYMAKFEPHEQGNNDSSAAQDAGQHFISHIMKGRLHQRKHGAL